MFRRRAAKSAEERKAGKVLLVGPAIAEVSTHSLLLINRRSSWTYGPFSVTTEEKFTVESQRTYTNYDLTIQALPDDNKPWWRQKHLVRLNALLLICCLTAVTEGYDGKCKCQVIPY